MNGQTHQYQKALPFCFPLCAKDICTGMSSPSEAGLILLESPPTAAITPMFSQCPGSFLHLPLFTLNLAPVILFWKYRTRLQFAISSILTV